MRAYMLVLAMAGAFAMLAGCLDDGEIAGMIMDDLKVQNAVASGNSANCAKLGSGANECYLKMAQGKKDADLCEKIDYLYGRQMCYSQVAAAKGDKALCNMVNDTALKNACIGKVASSLKDNSLCDGIVNDPKEQHMCRFDVAVAIGSAQACDGLNRAEMPGRESCYYKLAVKTRDVEYCLKTLESSQDNCIFDVAEEKKDASLCGRIFEADYADECYMSIAKKTKNEGLCNKIEHLDWKAACLKEFGK